MYVLYHGSPRLFRAFRVKGKKRPTDIKAKGRKVVYLTASRETAKRKYAKGGPEGIGYLYTVQVSDAIPYSEAIAKEGLRVKKASLTEGIYLSIPQYIRIVEIVRVFPDGREETIYSRSS